MLYDIDEKEIMFVGVDVPKQIENIIKELDDNFQDPEKILLSPTKKAYNYGIQNALSILKQYFEHNTEDGYITVHCPEKLTEEEYDIIDFMKEYGREVE